MARMIPEVPPADLPSSERLVFEAVRDRTPNSWRAVVRPRWTSAKNPRGASGETDLVLLMPDRGVLVLEVKGGSLLVERGQWFRRTANGQKLPLEKEPDRQAEDAVHHLVRYFKGLFTRKDRPSVEHALVFTGGRLEGSLGPSIPPDIVITRSDLVELESTITRICDYWSLSSTLTPTQIEHIVDLLMPSAEIHYDLRARTQVAEQQINRETSRQIRLTERQLGVLREINGVPRAVIYGGPGTGKTLLALERARRLAADGSDVLMVCATTGIGSFLYNSVEQSPELKTVVVRTLTLLMRELTERSDATSVSSFKALRSRWFQTFDALIIDEGQDFSPDDFQSLIALLRHSDTAPIYVFTDPNQAKLQLHDRKVLTPGETWKVPSWQHETCLLRDNCRNTREIVRLAGDLLGGSFDLEDANVSGPEPELVECQPESVAEATMNVIDRLLGVEGYAPGDIGVAVPVKATRGYRGPLGQRGIRTIPPNKTHLLGQPHNDRLDVASPRHFLGLERQVMVVVPPARAIEFQASLDGIALLRRWIFVGATRARTHCIVICTPYIKQLIVEPQRERFAEVDETIVALVSQFERSGASPPLVELGISLQEEIGSDGYQRLGRGLSAHIDQMPQLRMVLKGATPVIESAEESSPEDPETSSEDADDLRLRVSACIIDRLLDARATDTKLASPDLGQTLHSHFGKAVHKRFGFERLRQFIESMPELTSASDDESRNWVVLVNRQSP